MPAKKKKLAKQSDTIIFSVLAIVIFSISIFNLAVFFSPHKQKVVYAYEEQPQNNTLITFWNTFLEKNPNYLPGWLELAKLQIQNDDLTNAFLAASEALKIDPNSELVKNTLDEIDKEY